MAEHFRHLVQQYEEAKPHADPRTRDWLLVENSPWPVWILTAFYVLTVIVGPRVMRNTKPFDLKTFMVIYNLGLVALSVYMFVEIALSIWDAGYDLLCADYSPETIKNPKELRVAKVLWWYFFSKAIEFCDTWLMILRKKFDQITFLHVFHHASMLNIWWWTLMFIPGGMSWFGSWLNCLVHIVMYSYYGLSAIPSLRSKLWWKKYITRFQLIQFCITFSHTINSIRIGCDFPHWGQYLLASYMVVMLILFGNFYFQAYTRRRRDIQRKTADAATISAQYTNGKHVSNGRKHHANGEINGEANGFARAKRE